MRPLGDILLDLELIIDEMIYDHDLQWGDVRALTMQHMRTHNPDAQEKYVEGGSPIDFYGDLDSLIELCEFLRKNRRKKRRVRKRK